MMNAQVLQTLNTIEQQAYTLKSQLAGTNASKSADAILTQVNNIRRQLATESNVPTDKQVLHD